MMFDLPPHCSPHGRVAACGPRCATGCPRCRSRLSVSEAANLVNTVPGISAVHDLPYPEGRGKVFNALMWTAQRLPLLDPVRPMLTLLEFG